MESFRLEERRRAEATRLPVRAPRFTPGGAVETAGLTTWFSRPGAPDPEAWKRAHPLGRFGQPEDVARAALYLASTESSWVTGSVLVVDGGFSAQ